jgi:streptogramin lyase
LRRLAAVALGAACTLLLAASPALAAPQVNGEFSVSGLGTYNQITTGPDGNIWVTLDDTNDVARITPAGDVQEFNPASLDKPVGITTLGNNLWVTQNGSVAKFSPADPNAAEDFTIATLTSPQAITVGPDGNLWTASGERVFKIFPGPPVSFDFFDELTAAGARGVAAGGDGNIWFADAAGQRIVSLETDGDPAPGSPYDLGDGQPQGIAAGPGTQMAFTNPLSTPHTLGRITPGGSPQITNLPTSDPFGITLGPDGAYWIGQLSTNNLGRLTPSGDYTTLGGFTPAGGRGPRQLTSGPGNTLWVTLEVPGSSTNEAVARVTGFGEPPPGVPETPPGVPENDFEFGKVKKNKKKGTAKLTVVVPGPGEVELAKTKKVKGDEERAEAAGEVKLLVKPGGKAKGKLKDRGKVKVEAEVTYTPTGGTPNTEDKKLKLVKRD